MAAYSPALSSNGTDTAAAISTINTSKNLRGLNKPKCIKCGNVARSRCPYQSCKSCCAKAQNPCHIHVLKGTSTFPDKATSSGSHLFDQQSTDVSPSGSSHRVASLRQLSNSFAQFNNLQSPLRSRKPLTRKEAAAINEWRFLKLKEYKDRNIETENEAFDRYMVNASLLEEVFSVNSAVEGPAKDGSPTSKPSTNSKEDGFEMVVRGMKSKLRSNPYRAENYKKRMQYIVDQGLSKLQKTELIEGDNGLNEQEELVRRPKKKFWQAERVEALTDLIEKLNKTRNEEDLKSCLEMKAQLFTRHAETSEVESDTVTSKESTPQNVESFKVQSDYSPPIWFRTCTIDQEAVNHMDAHFSSLEEIEDL